MGQAARLSYFLDFRYGVAQPRRRCQPAGAPGCLAGDAVAAGVGKIERGFYGLGGFSRKENGCWRAAPVFCGWVDWIGTAHDKTA